MRRILITGADSFIGTNYMHYSEYKTVDEISLLDCEPEDVDFSNYDVVIHLVAIVHQSQSIPDAEYYKINRDLCIRVAKEARSSGVGQFVFLSTVKVYGDFIPGNGPWHEYSTCNPTDGYGKSKYEAEVKLKQLETKDFTVSIIRTPLVYGQGVKANMYNIIRLINNLPVLPLGGIENKRNFTYIENLVALLDLIIKESAAGIFIAMDEGSMSTTQLVRYISKALNKKRYLIPLPGFIVRLGTKSMPKVFDRLFGSFELNNSHTKQILGFSPPYTTEEGIYRTVQSFIER